MLNKTKYILLKLLTHEFKMASSFKIVFIILLMVSTVHLGSLNYNHIVPTGAFLSCLRVLGIISLIILYFVSITATGVLSFRCLNIRRKYLSNQFWIVNCCVFGLIVISCGYTLLGFLGLINKLTICIPIFSLVLLNNDELKKFKAWWNVCLIDIAKFLKTLTGKLIFITFFLDVLICLAPTSDWDSVAYHLPLIKRILEDGFISTYKWNDPFNLPAPIQILYSPFLAYNLSETVQLFNLAILFINIYVFIKLLKLLEIDKPIQLYVLILLSNPLIFSNAISARVETCMGLLVTSAIYLITHSYKYYGTYCIKLCLPIVIFLAFTKATGIMLSGALICAILFVVFKNWSFTKLTAPSGMLVYACLIIFIINCCWYGKNLIIFSNPLYPYFQSDQSYFTGETTVSLFKSASTILNNVEFPVDGDSNFINESLKVIAAPASIKKYDYDFWDLIFNQGAYVLKWSDKYCPLILIGILPIFLINRDLIPLGLFTLLSITGFVFNSQIIRYSIPIFIPLSVLTIFNIHTICQSFRSKRIINIILVLAFASYTIPFIKYYSESDLYTKIAYISGRISLNGYLDKVVTPSMRSDKITAFLNEDKSSSGNLLMLGNAQSFYLQREFIADYDSTARQLVPWLRLIVLNKGDLSQTRKYLLEKNVKYISLDLGYLYNIISTYRMYNKYNVWIKNYDRSDPELLAKTLISISSFVSIYCKVKYKDLNRKIFLFELV